MDRPADLLDEYDLTPEELRTKRRAEFDRWFDQPSVRLYEAVMLSLLVIPHPGYRLKTPLPSSRLPRYTDEFFFRSMRHPEQFHERMVLAVVALRTGLLKAKADQGSANESEYTVTLAEFERWANKVGIKVPDEWLQNASPSTKRRLTSQQRRKRNNLLRIIRALIRAADVGDPASLISLLERTAAPPCRSTVHQAFRAIALVEKTQDEMSPEEEEIIQQIPSPGDLVAIIASLTCLPKLRIDFGKKGAAKRIHGFVEDDRHSLGERGGTEPQIKTIENVVQMIQRSLMLADGSNRS